MDAGGNNNQGHPDIFDDNLDIQFDEIQEIWNLLSDVINDIIHAMTQLENDGLSDWVSDLLEQYCPSDNERISILVFDCKNLCNVQASLQNNEIEMFRLLCNYLTTISHGLLDESEELYHELAETIRNNADWLYENDNNLRILMN